MMRAQEAALAWRLIDAVGADLAGAARMWSCVKIGAGEYDVAISDTLEICASAGTALPFDVIESVRQWMRGYAGSDHEPHLRVLLERISSARSAMILPSSSHPLNRHSQNRTRDVAGAIAT